jgi:16S rRNA (cytosine967-C5)-methyltransferase
VTDSTEPPRGAARAAAAAAVNAVARQGVSLDRALNAQRRRFSIPERDGPLVQELAYGTLRHYWSLERRVAPLMRRRTGDMTQALLLVGTYQLTQLATPAHAAVSETVSASDALGLAHAKGFINAVLRALLRSQREVSRTDDPDFDHPAWLRRRVQQGWPDRWAEILDANNRRPPMSLRINVRKLTRAAYREMLEASKIESVDCMISDVGLNLAEPAPVGSLPGFSEGWVSVQDCAAQLAAPFLAAHAGDRVADLCAAPGGKAAHVLEREAAIAELVAVERQHDRVERLRGTFERLGLSATVHRADATDLGSWWDGRPFERVLLDAPCSGTGVVRRHPDIKHLKREGDLEVLAQTQESLLRAGFELLAPGGRLLYVTCSILPEENDAVVNAFLAREPRARSLALSAPAGQATSCGWQLLPGVHGDSDGFYYALVQRHR